MNKYESKELVSVEELSKNLKSYLDKLLIEQSVERFVITRNDKPCTVLLSADEYERIKKFYELNKHLHK